MADTRYAYKDLSHPSYQNDLRVHNAGILTLVQTVAEFAQKISLAHEDFSRQVQLTVEAFKSKNQELQAERPPDCHSSLAVAWETLLQETQYDAQAHSDAASLLINNVYTPLTEISGYKESQTKKLFNFRQNVENILATSEENIKKVQNSYTEAYRAFRSNQNSRDAQHFVSEYYNEHNEYVLQIRATNRQEEEYNNSILPYILQEVEEINIDVANTLNGSIESHALLLLTKANEQSRRFDTILQVCRQVHPKSDISSYLTTICKNEEPAKQKARHYRFIPPTDPGIPGAELGALKGTIILDKHTESVIHARRKQLQKEAAELTSYLKQNQDITHTLINVCQRNLANHLYNKVYETQEDLCRKRNDIRMANLQLAAIRAQIEVLQHKQNGSALEPDQESTASSKTSKASIKGMWKKAFKSLKSTKEPKEKEQKESKEKPVSSRERLLESDNIEKMEQEKPKYSRMSSRQSSLQKKGLFRKESKESPTTEETPPPVDLDTADSVFRELRLASRRKRQPGKLDNVDDGSNLTGSKPKLTDYY